MSGGVLVKYRVFCVTENKYVEALRADEPERCPNDFRHVIDRSLTEAVESYVVEGSDLQTAGSATAGGQTSANVLAECSVDAMGRFRTSQAQSLVGSDFSYGFGIGEWETLELVNNVPTSYFRYGDPKLPVASIRSRKDSRRVRVTCSSAHGLASGDALIVAGSKSDYADGSFVVNVRTPTVFTYPGKGVHAGTEELFVTGSTDVYRGRHYQGSVVPIADIRSDQDMRSTLTVTTDHPNGFAQGTFVNIANSMAETEVLFDAEDVEHQSSVTYSNVIDCSQASLSNYDFNHFPVVAFEWIGTDSVFFNAADDADADADEISLPGGRPSRTTRSSCTCTRPGRRRSAACPTSPSTGPPSATAARP